MLILDPFFPGFPEAAYKNRPSSGEKVSMLAKSMPMNTFSQKVRRFLYATSGNPDKRLVWGLLLVL